MPSSVPRKNSIQVQMSAYRFQFQNICVESHDPPNPKLRHQNHSSASTMPEYLPPDALIASAFPDIQRDSLSDT